MCCHTRGQDSRHEYCVGYLGAEYFCNKVNSAMVLLGFLVLGYFCNKALLLRIVWVFQGWLSALFFCPFMSQSLGGFP